MSTFSRMHDEYLTPPEGRDPHPWSEELCGLLEDAGLSEEQYHHACNLFDKAIEADPVVLVTTDDLFTQASLCREFDENKAIFWRNKTGRDEAAYGSSYAEVLCKVMDELRGDALTPEAEEVSDYLSNLLDDDTFETASNILLRVKRVHVYTTPPQPQDAEDAARWRWARKMKNRERAADILKFKMNADAAIDAARVAAKKENV